MILIQYFFQPDEDIVYFNDRYLDGELNIMFNELEIPFSDLEVKKACANLNPGKSAGNDYMINEFCQCETFVDMLFVFNNNKKLYCGGDSICCRRLN